MALNRYRVGDLIKQRREKYDGIEKLSAYGVTREGFIPPKQDGADTSIYNVFYRNDFVFNPARMELNSIALNTQFDKAMCSSLYEIFYVERTDLALPEYLNLYIKRSEFARKCWFSAIGSARNYFRIGDLSEFEIDLPPIEIQKKYINIYKAMLKNQEAYEKGLDDLKLCCDAYIENLRKNVPCKELGFYIEESNSRNADGNTNVLGISKDGFINPKQDTGNLEKYKVFSYNYFVYSPPRINIGSIGLYKENKEAVCSPIYVVFKVKNEEDIDSDFLMMHFKRDEFLRATDFYSIASVRNNFSYDTLCEMKFPIPNIATQRSIADIYRVYCSRKEINEKLKKRLADICSILIKGSLEEANK